jgi:excisionase family DNA binding protein
MKAEELKDIMDVREASEYLKIKPSTLYKYVNEGTVPGFRVGNLWRFTRTSLDRWIEEKMQEPQKKERLSPEQARKLLRGSGKGENLVEALLRSRREDLQIE